jgi:enamine deaminase RidA (YjgF/YER057c/UK114 family)
MEVVQGGIEEQTKQVMRNLESIVKASGSELGKVVKTTVRSYSELRYSVSPNHSPLSNIYLQPYLPLATRL